MNCASQELIKSKWNSVTHSPSTADEIGASNVGAEARGVPAGLEDEDEPNVEEGNAAEDKVAPLIARVDESTNEACNDHDFVEKQGPEDRWPRQARGEEQVQKQ